MQQHGNDLMCSSQPYGGSHEDRAFSTKTELHTLAGALAELDLRG
jgi:hypothetical protein